MNQEPNNTTKKRYVMPWIDVVGNTLDSEATVTVRKNDIPTQIKYIIPAGAVGRFYNSNYFMKGPIDKCRIVVDTRNSKSRTILFGKNQEVEKL